MSEQDIKIILDTETTGLDFKKEKIIEFAAVKLVDGEITEEYETLINPEQEIRHSSYKIHGISQEMVEDQPKMEEVLPKILEFIGDYPIVAHNVIFDYSFLNEACKNILDKKLTNPTIDSQHMFKEVFPNEHSSGLDALMKRFDVSVDGRHRAMADTMGLALCFDKLEKLYIQRHSFEMAQLENIEYLFERYLRLQSASQTLQSEMADIKSIFKIYFENGGESITSTTGETLYYNRRPVYNYDFETIKPALEKLGRLEKVIKLNNGLIDRIAMSSNVEDDIKEQLNAGKNKLNETKSVAIQKPGS